MAGKFEVYKDARSKFRFRLKSGNGQIIAVGEAYESMPACLAGIEAIRAAAPSATVADMTMAGSQVKAGAGASAGNGAGTSTKHSAGASMKAGAGAGSAAKGSIH